MVSLRIAISINYMCIEITPDIYPFCYEMMYQHTIYSIRKIEDTINMALRRSL